MQQRPTKPALLQAIARFLISEVYPNIPDKRLNFRVLIAANLANMVASEMDAEQALVSAELARLAELMPDAAARQEQQPSSDLERSRLLAELNRELAARIRARRLSPAEKRRAWAHAKESLIRTLAVDNPRFDAEPEIE